MFAQYSRKAIALVMQVTKRIRDLLRKLFVNIWDGKFIR